MGIRETFTSLGAEVQKITSKLSRSRTDSALENLAEEVISRASYEFRSTRQETDSLSPIETQQKSDQITLKMYQDMLFIGIFGTVRNIFLVLLSDESWQSNPKAKTRIEESLYILDNMKRTIQSEIAQLDTLPSSPDWSIKSIQLLSIRTLDRVGEAFGQHLTSENFPHEMIEPLKKNQAMADAIVRQHIQTWLSPTPKAD